jgi:hypothetical protein
MADLADRSDKTSIASDAPTLLSTASTAGNSAFSRLRRARSVADQARDAAKIPLEQLPFAVEDLPTISHKGNRYILEEWLSKKNRTSWIGKHGIWLARLQGDKADGSFWCCELCSSIFNSQATSAAAQHLKKSHSITETAGDAEEGSSAVEGPSKRMRLATGLRSFATASHALRVPVLKSTAEMFRETMLNWIVDSDLPFSVVQNPHFRSLLMQLNAEKVASLLPESGSTVRRWLDDLYDQQLALLKRSLASSPAFKKHLSFDLWTSPNSIALLAVIVHYLDGSGTLQTNLLALQRIKGSHSGDNLAQGVVKVVEHFGLAQQLGYFQSDNVDSNDGCISAVLQHVNPELTTVEITKLKTKRRLRCFGHILNLVAKAFLEGSNKNILRTLEEGSQARLDAEQENELLSQWRKAGPIGKLHYLVHFIRRSPQRRKSFLEVAKGQLSEEEREEFGSILLDANTAKLQLQADNDTRWNSVYLMIERAMVLKDPLEVFSVRWSREKDPQKRLNKEMLLTASDWAVLTEILAILEPFKIITKKFEGRDPNFGEVIAHAYTLHRDLEQLSQQYSMAFEKVLVASPEVFSVASPLLEESPRPPSQPRRPQRASQLPRRFEGYEVDLPGLRNRRPGAPYGPQVELGDPVVEDLDRDGFNTIQTSLRLAIEKLRKYVDLMETSPAYWATMILLPGCRARWIQRFFVKERGKAELIVGEFKEFFEEEYPGEAQAHSSPERRRPHYLYGDDFYDPPEAIHSLDEVAAYLGEPVRPVKEPLQWWLSNQERFPRLSKMAFDMLSIPPMSTECERTFSLAKLAVGMQRHSTQEDTISKLQCLKNWLRNRASSKQGCL